MSGRKRTFVIIKLMFILALVVLIGLTVFLAVFLVKSDRGAKEPPSALALAFGFGIMAVGAALWLEKHLLPAGSLFQTSLLISAIEETAKFLPLALFIRSRKYFNEHNDGLIYFGLAGLAFGFVENLSFLFNSTAQVGLSRAYVLLFFHPAATGIVGYFFARRHLDKKPLTHTALAFAGVILLHALYNFGLMSGLVVMSLMITALLNTAYFLFYRRAEDLDHAAGLSAEGENRFCRHCGESNPKHYLYCEHCGNQT